MLVGGKPVIDVGDNSPFRRGPVTDPRLTDDQAPIERAEVVALLFNVSDIAVTLTNIERLPGEADGEEEADEV